MAAKIETAIQPQSFELIRDRVASILEDEIPAQATLHADEGINAAIFKERIVPFGVEEMPAINVSVNPVEFTAQTQITTKAVNTIYIDVFVKEKSDSADDGDTLAGLRTQQIAGIVKGILEANVYDTLGFPYYPETQKPFIIKRKVSRLQTGKIESQQDGANVAMARLTLEVEAIDEHMPQATREMDLSTVVFTVCETEIGHKVEFPTEG